MPIPICNHIPAIVASGPSRYWRRSTWTKSSATVSSYGRKPRTANGKAKVSYSINVAAEVEQEKRRVTDPWEDLLQDMPYEVDVPSASASYTGETRKIIHLEFDSHGKAVEKVVS